MKTGQMIMLGMAGVLGLILIESLTGDERVDYGPKLLSPTMAVKTPHLFELKPAAQGRVKVLFITWRGGMREVVELAQRFDLDYTVFAMDEQDEFFTPDPEGSCAKALTSEKMMAEMKGKLAGTYDCVVLGNINWAVLPLRARYEVLRKVKEGTSLVALIKKPDVYWEKAVAKKEPAKLEGVYPWKGLPEFSCFPDTQAWVDETLRVARFGKGRIIEFKSYTPPAIKHFTLQMLTPPALGKTISWENVCRDEYDYYLAWAWHWILEAAGKPPVVRVTGEGYARGKRNELAGVDYVLKTAVKRKVECRFTLKDRWGMERKTERKQVDLMEGENHLRFEIGRIAAGGYFANLLVYEGGKAAGFGAIYVDVDGDMRIGEIEMAKSFKGKEDVKGKVLVRGAGKEGVTIKTTRMDNYGRITGMEMVPVIVREGSSCETVFSVAATAPLSIVQYLFVELLTGGEVLDRKRIMYSISDFYPPDDVRYAVWTYMYAHSYLGLAWMEEIKKAGFDFQYGGFGETVPMANLWLIPYATRFYDHNDMPPRTINDHVRRPCLTDPVWQKQEGDKLLKEVEKIAPWSTPIYSLGDECYFSHEPYELCFSDTCRDFFHQFLRTEYKTLETLNREYGTNYKTFEEIKPITLDEVAADPGKTPLWVDFRRCMESNWAGAFERFGRLIREKVPEAKVGYEGTDHRVTSFRADDFWKLMKVLDFNGPYYSDFITHAVVDFARPGSVVGGGWYGGYNPFRSEIYSHYISWRQLFFGANAFMVWQAYPGSFFGNITAPDFSFYDFFKANIEEVKEIKRGIGKLLMGCSRSDDGVAVLYSASSVHMGTLTKGLPTVEKTLNILIRLLEDAGFGYRIVSYEEVEKGLLRGGKYRVILLPYAQALSDGEISEITDFVKGGGVAIADLRPGVTDEHGKRRERGALDELFGVAQDAKAAKTVAGRMKTKWPVEKEFETVGDGGLRIGDADSHGAISNVPCMAVKQHGKGRTVLLNFSLTKYVESDNSQTYQEPVGKEADAIVGLCEALLLESGVSHQVVVSPKLDRLRNYRFMEGNNMYVGLLQELPELPIRYALGTAKPLLETAAKMKTTLGKRHIYDLRAGKYLGYTDAIEVNIKPGIAKLFALMDYQVTAVVVNVPLKARQGEKLDYTIEVRSKDGHVGSHVAHIEVYDPEGREAEWYAGNIRLNGGRGVGRLNLSSNEKTGTWRLRICDMASGKIAEVKYTVEKNTP
ncbi:MAG: beta-galactosidase [Verrucomicrobiae bacterium]|nr:beta-galactosidase [Verrucomicrobiae bacterium]